MAFTPQVDRLRSIPFAQFSGADDSGKMSQSTSGFAEATPELRARHEVPLAPGLRSLLKPELNRPRPIQPRRKVHNLSLVLNLSAIVALVGLLLLPFRDNEASLIAASAARLVAAPADSR